MKIVIEPFRIKCVEPIRFTTEAERKDLLQKAGFNLFNLHADDVIIDLLTDSGTSAMSARQWAGIMEGDESYAGARSFLRFEKTVRELTGYKHVIPTHQGRAAERILMSVLGGPDRIIPNNTHFDTTRANIEVSGAEAVDFPSSQAADPALVADFKGNMDTKALEKFFGSQDLSRVPFCMTTVTNNSSGGQPVSMQNLREVSALCKKYGVMFLLDACRFAENAYFIKMREPGYADRPMREIAKEMFSLADGCTMSAKKDALVNIGGFLALNDDDLAQQARNQLIVTEGFPTYGGLAGRDLEAVAQGLDEVLEEDYLRYRIRSTAFVGEHLLAEGVPIYQPPGGHAIYVDAKAMLPHVPPEKFPGQALACAFYLKGGIRSCEIGSVMFGKTGPGGKFIPARQELVRLAIPRRVYTQSHMEYLVECIAEVNREKESIKGMRIVKEPPVLRHFQAVFAPEE